DALGFEPLNLLRVVDERAERAHGRALGERPLDHLHGALDAETEPVLFGQQNLHGFLICDFRFLICNWKSAWRSAVGLKPFAFFAANQRRPPQKFFSNSPNWCAPSRGRTANEASHEKRSASHTGLPVLYLGSFVSTILGRTSFHKPYGQSSPRVPRQHILMKP